MQKLNGFIKVHRKLVQWGWYQDYVVKDLFLHLLLTASFKEGRWLGRTIQKGQVITSNKHLAEELGFSVQQIRTALTKLKSTGEITSEATNKFTIITVVNWEKYQVIEVDETSNSTHQATNEQQTSNIQATNEQQTSNIQATNEQQHLKNVKNNKECKEGKENSPVGQLSSFGEPLPPGMTMEEFEARYKEMTR